MTQFRVSLGRVQDATNLVTNGTFNTDISGWTADAGWSWDASGQAAKASGTFNYLSQNILTRGKVYKVSYDLTSVNVTGAFFGEYGNEKGVAGSNEFTHRCIGSTWLRIGSNGAGAPGTLVDNVECYEMVYNTPLSDEPDGLKEGSITIERNIPESFISRKFTNDLVFWGDGYDYLENERSTNGLCAEVECLIEQLCEPDGDWETLHEGIIYISNCDFDPVRCTVTATVEDIGAAQVLRNNKNVKIFYDPNTIFFGFRTLLVDPTQDIDYHDDTGARPANDPYNNNTSLLLFETLQRAVHFMSNTDVAFKSDFFDSGGTFANLVLQFGFRLQASQHAFPPEEQYTLTWDQLFKNLNAIFNLGINVTTLNGEPTIELEPKEDLLGASVVLTLNDVLNLTFEYVTEELYKTVDVGYKKDIEVSGDDIEFLNDASVQYVSTVDCTDKNLVAVSEFIASSDVIFRVLGGFKGTENSVRNGTFDSGLEDWNTTGGWVPSGGTALHTPGLANSLFQRGVTRADCNFDGSGECRYEVTFTISGRTAGDLTVSLGGNSGTTRSTNGTFTEIINSDTISDQISFAASSTFNGALDNVSAELFEEKDNFNEDVFIIQTNGTQSTIGAGNVYNEDLQPADNMTRWVETLASSFDKDRSTTETITKSNNPLMRLWTFDYPLSKTNFDLLSSNIQKIAFNSPDNNITTDIEGYIVSLERNNLTGDCSFVLLSE